MRRRTLATIAIVAGLTIFSFGIFSNQHRIKERRISVIATAYCPCPICCGDFADGITATGRDAALHGVAVDPSVIPLGSFLDIPQYNRGPNHNGSWIVADDVGGAIKGNRIDVRFETHQEAKEWGVRRLNIRVHSF